MWTPRVEIGISNKTAETPPPIWLKARSKRHGPASRNGKYAHISLILYFRPASPPPSPPLPLLPPSSYDVCTTQPDHTSKPQRIQEGAYYEAHQQLRVLCQRYTKAENYEAAIDIAFSGAQALLQAGQGGSGVDLSTLMVEVYTQGDVTVDAESKGGCNPPPHLPRYSQSNMLTLWGEFGWYKRGYLP